MDAEGPRPSDPAAGGSGHQPAPGVADDGAEGLPVRLHGPRALGLLPPADGRRHVDGARSDEQHAAAVQDAVS